MASIDLVNMKNYQKFFNKELLWPSVLAFVFLIAVWWLPATTPHIFNSPDEMANFYFSKNVTEHTSLTVSEPLNNELGNRVYPRSIAAGNGTLRPLSFIGLPVIYGVLAKIFTVRAISFFTGFIAAISGLVLYLLLRKFFEKKWALLGTFLLFINPAYLYYSARGMFHNVLFVDALLVALLVGGIIGALVMFVALLVRTFEGLWVWPVFTWLGDKRFKITAVLVVAVNAVILFFIRPGYPLDLFPFGISLRRVLSNIWHIQFVSLWWWTVPAIFGMIIWAITRRQKTYLLAGILGALWLSFYYGTYVVGDNPSGQLTIVSSLFRYWLPIFIWEIPFIVLLVATIGDWLWRKKLWRVAWPILIIGGMAFASSSMVWLGDDGLLAVRANIRRMENIKEAVLKLTEPNAIIISDRGTDKMFFPDRRVIYDLRDEHNWPQYEKLVSFAPAYYYGIGLNHQDPIIKVLSDKGIALERVAIFDKEALYRLKIKNQNAK